MDGARAQSAPRVGATPEPGTRRATPRRPFWEIVASPLFLIVSLVALEWATRAFRIPAYVVPAPSKVLAALWADLNGGLAVHLRATLTEIAAGFLIGTVVALIIGVLMTQWRFVEVTLYPYVVALQTVPKLAIAPLFIVWFGFGIESKIAVAALTSFFPVLINTVVGLRLADADMLDLMTSLRATRWQTLRMVKLPNALPVISAGIEVAIVLSVLGAVVGEFLGASEGLGYLLVFRNQKLDTAGVFAVLIVLGVLGYALDWGVRMIRRRLAFWAPADDVHRP